MATSGAGGGSPEVAKVTVDTVVDDRQQYVVDRPAVGPSDAAQFFQWQRELPQRPLSCHRLIEPRMRPREWRIAARPVRVAAQRADPLCDVCIELAHRHRLTHQRAQVVREAGVGGAAVVTAAGAAWKPARIGPGFLENEPKILAIAERPSQLT